MDDLPDLSLGNKRAIQDDYIDETDDTPIEREPPKAEAVREKLFSVLRTVNTLKWLNDELTNDMIDFCCLKTFKAGEVVFRQDDPSIDFYIVEKGHFHCTRSENRGPEKHICTYKDQGTFGEAALCDAVPRVATVIAGSDGGQLWQLPRMKYRTHVTRVAHQREQFLEATIRKMRVSKRLSDEEILTVTDAMRPRMYQPNDVLLSKNDPADGFYIVERGTIEASMELEGRARCVARYQRGDYFGELAVLYCDVRDCTLTATTEVTVAFVPLEESRILLGPCVSRSKTTTEEQQNLDLKSSKSAD